MNLIDVKRKVRELASFLKYKEAEIDAKRNTIKATRFDKIITSGSAEKRDMPDLIAEIVEMEKDLDYVQKEYNRLVPLINELEAGYKELGERDKLIYLEYHCKGYSAIKIGFMHGISEKHVYKILSKVEKNIRNDTK